VAEARPELELLLLCARSRVDAGRAERVRALLRSGVDWPYLTRAAARHAVTPLLYWSLNAVDPDAVPAPVLAQLQEQFQQNAAGNVQAVWELIQLLKRLEAQSIEAVPFKGPAVAAAMYGNIALRVFGDLDLLVRKPDAIRARDLLMAQGYQPETELTATEAEASIESGWAYHFVLRHARGWPLVELHWALSKRFRAFGLAPERLWERLQTVSLLGTPVRCFAPEDALLVLCQHGAKHEWAELRWVCDIAELVRAYPALDWDATRARAEALGARRMLATGLLLASDLLGAAVPEGVLRTLRSDGTARRLCRQTERRFLRGHGGRPPGLEGWLFRLGIRERWRDRLPYFLDYLPQQLLNRLTPNAADRALVRLPRPLAFLYVVLRPVRLAAAYGRERLRKRRAPEEAG
jgi:hypothetical protein